MNMGFHLSLSYKMSYILPLKMSYSLFLKKYNKPEPYVYL